MQILHRRGHFRGGWWLLGGVNASNCVAAYRMKGAGSQQASKINLANPGTYNAVSGSYDPVTYNESRGWIVAPNNYTPASTGIGPAVASWSLICQFANGANTSGRCLGGCGLSTCGFLLYRRHYAAPNYATWINGGSLTHTSSLVAGNMAMAGSTAYLNGTAVGTIPSPSPVPYSGNNYIGVDYADGGFNAGSDLIAWAIYNTTLTAVQVAAICEAMAAF